MITQNLQNKDVTEGIIKAFYKVYNTLGYGFLEKVYENALFLEIQQMGLKVKQQQPIKVYYSNIEVGDYFADLIVEDLVIIELKVADCISAANEAQLLNYLRATGIEIGLLLNFGPKPEFKRKVYSQRKKSLLSVFEE